MAVNTVFTIIIISKNLMSFLLSQNVFWFSFIKIKIDLAKQNLRTKAQKMIKLV